MTGQHNRTVRLQVLFSFNMIYNREQQTDYIGDTIRTTIEKGFTIHGAGKSEDAAQAPRAL